MKTAIHHWHAASPLGLRGIALVEGAKALVALMAATGLTLHWQLRPLVDAVAVHLHLNPAHDRPLALLDALMADADAHLQLLALGALVYAAVRVVEAFGLWHGKAWALWCGAISAAIYLPFEAVELFEHPGTLTVVLLCLNVVVALYLVSGLAARRPGAQAGG